MGEEDSDPQASGSGNPSDTSEPESTVVQSNVVTASGDGNDDKGCNDEANTEKLATMCSRLSELDQDADKPPSQLSSEVAETPQAEATEAEKNSGSDDVVNISSDSIIHLLITEDMQRIQDRECLINFFQEHFTSLPVKSVAEILSVLIAVLKKSLLNLEDAKGILINCIKFYCVKSPQSGSYNLIKHFLREIINLLSSYSCDVQELKWLLSSSQEDARLLHIIRGANCHQKGRPSAFFAFPGTKGSVLALPPLVKWPTQNGWTFISWFRLEPNSVNSQPYLYFFRTSKSGIGYSAHFTGNCLVLTSMKIKGKGYQHCIPYEFVPFKWYHCAIAYVTKWRGSEIKVFVNGQMTANTEMSWQVQTQDIFDKCFIGGTADLVSESHLFCGQLSAIYLFHEALTASQICAIHRLGPSYMGQYRYPNEMGLFDNMPVMMKKVLYEEKLSTALISLYTPVAVEGDTLCLQLAPKGNVSYFASSPHAALLGNTKAISTRSISDTLQSIGGIKSLLLLLYRYTGLHGVPPDPEACSTLIGFICDLLESSPLWFGNEVVQSHGFIIISSLLAKNPRLLINENTLEIILNLTKTLMSAMSTSLTSSSGDSILLKQLMDSILFNSSLWIYVDAKIQLCLYCYLATEFLTVGAANAASPASSCDNLTSSSSISNNSGGGGNDSVSNYSCNISTTQSGGAIFSEVRRISTVLQLFHSLKYYYWLVPEDPGPSSLSSHSNNIASSIGIYSITTHPVQVKARESNYRPSRNDLISIRSYILLFIKQLIVKGNGVHHDELQAILNYLSTVHQDLNLLDVLQMLQTLMVEHPSSMIPAFDMKHGVRTIFKLLDSANEEIRIQSIKLLGYFLSRSTPKRKQDVMGPNNLFMLLRERLIRFTPLSIDTYNALFEILVETPIETIRSNTSASYGNLRIENPMILKVIATLITDGKKLPPVKSLSSNRSIKGCNSNDRCDHYKIKKLFISDLWRLLVNHRENRRLVLQMSVWQHWLVNLIEDRHDHIVRDQILAIFRVLLYHAIKYEFGGWRVWIDTLAIIHAKISFDDFMSQFGEKKDKNINLVAGKGPKPVPPAVPENTSGDSSQGVKPVENIEPIKEQGKQDNKDKPLTESSPEQTKLKQRSEISPSSPAEDMADEEDSRPEDERELNSIENKEHAEVENESFVKIEDATKESVLHEIEEVPEGKVKDIQTGDQEKSVEMEEKANANTKASETVESSDPDQVAQEDQDQGDVEEDEVQARISTISSSQNSTIHQGDSNKSTPEIDDKSGVTETDVAPSRAYRKPTHNSLKDYYNSVLQNSHQRPHTHHQNIPGASATPAFRIPEFRWSSLHLKLLNDLFYSIECDLQMWKSQSSKDAMSAASGKEAENKSGVILTVSASQLDQLLQHPDNQIYIVNAIHLLSQLCDNIIIASGGLLPLLAAATGGNNSPSGSATNQNSSNAASAEGLSLVQANSLLYRLVNMADLLCFAATHVNFAELESEKNMSSGGILRQCLRLVCTVAVKNCLAVQKHDSKVDNFNPTRDTYYLGTPISTVATELFGGYSVGSDASTSINDIIDGISSDLAGTSLDSSSDNYSPLHPYPIKDLSKLLQEMDVNRLRACIYRDAEADAKQSQFLALATLYFISVLMVSEYRDIIESKSSQKEHNKRSRDESIDEDMGTSGLPKLRTLDPEIDISPSNIGNILTTKLEQRLSSICPLLREIMCDFASFLSKTLLGSHGQDLVSKEAVRTFRRPNASPVELVMLLCSQEWQNTLQKNAGLAFIELINEGRLLSHAMKDHIVRVAMEAEFILNRLRADDVSKHEQFNIACLETLAARAHEEMLINSLINSAKRRDRMIYIRFKEYLVQQQKRLETDRNKLFYRLDTWEDDARRRRRFLLDPHGEDNLAQQSESVMSTGEKFQPAEKEPQNLPAHVIIPKQQQPSSTRDGSDDENDLFLWESEELSSSLNGDIDERPSSAAEFSGTVLYSVDCNLIWNIYAIEGTLQITANELFFEATNINENVTVDGSIISKSSDNKNKSRPGSGGSNKDIKGSDESLKGLAGSSGGKLGKGCFRDLDLRVLRYCDLLTYNGKIPFPEIRAIFSRKYLLQPIALEIFVAQRTSVMFVFSDAETIKKVVKYLPPVGVGVKYGIPQARRASLMTPKQLFAASNMTQKWQKREISNFEYLMFLNTIAGRTYQDLNQYPVFPWILTNYDSPELDLSQPTNFRDLSKPVGALNSERRAEFVERYNSWDNSHIPAFHYGTHYSTAAFTLGWLNRLEPFHSAYLALQDGRVEDESRLFTSIQEAWLGSLMGGQQNVKELIPELFYLPEVLTGTEPESVRCMKPVELPKWADSPEHFVRLHRMALESELVSCQLHQWIDLIFGYKQRGPEAIRAVNVFYYLTYEGNVDLSQISCNDPGLKEAIEAQIRHFGQTPSQLTTEPHPPKSSALHVSPLMFSPVMDEVCMSVKFPFNAAIVNISACASHNTSASTASSIPSMIVTINSAQNYHIHKWNPKEANQPFTLDPALTNSTSSSSAPNRRHVFDTTSLCCMSSSSAVFSPRYIVTIDSKHVIMAPFYDNSFRVYSTDTGKLTQVIYGHRGLVTCLSRSECNIAADFYVASGSVDCSVLFWTWNAKYAQIEGNNSASAISGNPLPKLTLTGHESTILSILISAELGLIASGSKNTILIHSITNGDCITMIDVRKKFLSRTINSLTKTESSESDSEKIKATLEASMTGDIKVPSPRRSSQSSETNDQANRSLSTNVVSSNSVATAGDEDEDYLICNLLLARELAFIVGTAIPVEKKKSDSKKASDTASVSSSTSESCSRLFTYNLRGELHKCITFPRPKDLSSLLMTITRDGEYIILSESPYTIKILRTFDTTPLYCLNTNDLLTSTPNTDLASRDSGHGANAIKSMLLIDFKYLFVGTENGRLVIYKLDFNRWHHEYSSRY